ncbi:MAG: hypothetical protein CBB68_07840 [Rhodospirillaceae bacterium TMED8]|nr:hypothetical protein [Magnetovibrio sp.]OUT50888.1 MAG: hypothetical protein CBB68_07840 [Rhodospirillaceae bacterium TMED8]|tara:strand:- start:814 stop:1671 length:858 start_codon:yes stop_codon:yes gene_type:complete
MVQNNILLSITGVCAALHLTFLAPNHVYSEELVSHRAVYGMKLKSAVRGSGISGATGKMIYNFQSSCEGWASDTNVKLVLFYKWGDIRSTIWSFASWEARNGSSYHFHSQQAENGVITEVLKGIVKRRSNNRQIVVKFATPMDTEITLHRETLFPSMHLKKLFAAVKSDAKMINRVVFDGTSIDNPYEINAVVSRGSPLRGTKRVNKLEQILNKAGFPTMKTQHFRLAFFADIRQQMITEQHTPKFELGIDYRADGVARFIRQDFDTFSIDLELENIEKINELPC